MWPFRNEEGFSSLFHQVRINRDTCPRVRQQRRRVVDLIKEEKDRWTGQENRPWFENISSREKTKNKQNKRLFRIQMFHDFIRFDVDELFPIHMIHLQFEQ